MTKIVNQLRNPKESFYQALLIIFGGVIWAILALTFLAAIIEQNQELMGYFAFYGVGITLFILVAAALYRAHAFGNMVLLGPQQCPEFHKMVVEGSQKLGMIDPPKAFLYNSNGVMNAFARRLLGGRYVFLTSALVEVTNDAQVQFIIGHELGHHAAGHLNPVKVVLEAPARMLVPFLGPAYSRAREYTCDSVGAYLCNDVKAARTSLQMLGCGCRRLNGTLNCEAFMAQEEMVPGFFGFIGEIFRSHPRLTRRVRAIRDYSTLG
jgi:Zn-dependent protease with chaperone function